MDTDVATLLSVNAIASLVDMASHAPAGAFVEVGVYKGGSAWLLHKIAEPEGREIHLFDTFAGMPHATDRDKHPVGDLRYEDIDLIREACPTAKVHVGVFPTTMPPDLDGIAFAHVDCDQYQSVRDSIEHLWPRMVPGGVMLFDDYEWIEGARYAVDGFFGECINKNRWGKVYAKK